MPEVPSLEVPGRRSQVFVIALTFGGFALGLALSACGTTTLGSATADADSRAAKIFADCNDQLRSGKLASYRQAVDCARGPVIMAYSQAGFPYMDLVLFDLQEREVGAERIDFGTAKPADVYRDIATLDQRLAAERDRRAAARSGIGGAVPATRPEQLLAGLTSLGALPAAKDTECFSVGSFTHCNK
ncbi:MAG TPA: hypothetical protein VHX19_15540 [Stellaceae bacterium]|jgi:hypothetical protein|nr:hypothetical protein [Stellaceae bacterium]